MHIDYSDLYNKAYSVFNVAYDTTLNAVTDVQDKTLELANDFYSSVSVTENSTDIIEDDRDYTFSTTYLSAYQTAELYQILSSSNMDKVLVLDKEIAIPLFRHIVSSSALIEKFNVKKIYFLNNFCIDQKKHHYIYLFRPNSQNVKDFELIYSIQNSEMSNNCHSVYFIPERRSSELRYEVPYKGDFNVTLFPMSHDLISMEYKKAFRKLNCELDDTSLLDLVLAIAKIEKIYGSILNIQAQGKYAKILESRLESWGKPEHPVLFPAFARLTIIDRTEDLITPCLTPTTFEGLLDEFLGITGNIIEIEKKWISKEIYSFLRIPEKSPDSEKIEVPLSKNKVYNRLKDANIESLQSEFKSIQCMHTQMEDEASVLLKTEGLGATEFNLVMKKMKANEKSRKRTIIAQDIFLHLHDRLKQLSVQKYMECESDIITKKIGITKAIAFLQLLIEQKKPLVQVFRILTLLCQVCGRPNSELFSNIHKMILDTYGETSLFALDRLEKIGVFASVDFTAKKKKFNLIENFNENDPENIAYTYGGYAPLSCRYVGKMLKNPLKNPCKGMELVLFVGGCTRAEVSACRLISKNIVVLTTSIITGNTFMEALL